MFYRYHSNDLQFLRLVEPAPRVVPLFCFRVDGAWEFLWSKMAEGPESKPGRLSFSYD